MKKGQGLSMNVIIIAAISLLVLVILSVLVLRSGVFLGKANSCVDTAGGRCEFSCEDIISEETWIRDFGHGCANQDQVCCIRVGA